MFNISIDKDGPQMIHRLGDVLYWFAVIVSVYVWLDLVGDGVTWFGTTKIMVADRFYIPALFGMFVYALGWAVAIFCRGKKDLFFRPGL